MPGGDRARPTGVDSGTLDDRGGALAVLLAWLDGLVPRRNVDYLYKDETNRPVINWCVIYGFRWSLVVVDGLPRVVTNR